MNIQLTTEKNTLFNVFPLSSNHCEVHKLSRLFHKASHKKKDPDAIDFLEQLELQLENLCKQQSTRKLPNVTETQLTNMLKNISTAIVQFEQHYKAACPFAGIVSSPLIKRLKTIYKKAQVALNQIEN